MGTNVTDNGQVLSPAGRVDVSTAPFTLDASDPRFYDESNRPAYEWIHDNGGIYFIERPAFTDPFVNVCTHELIRVVGMDPDLFNVRHGMHLNSAMYAIDDQPMPDDPRLAVVMRPPMTMDREEHRKVRGPVNLLMRPRAIGKYDAMIRDRVRGVVDELEPGVEIDLMKTLAHQVPVRVITSILGVDPEHDADFDRWAKNLFESFEPGGTVDWDTTLEMIDFIEAEVGKRRSQPSDDLISDVVAAGLPQGDLQAVMWSWVLLVGGIDTTEYTIGHAVRNLLLHPEQMRAVAADPALVRNVVAETLRLRSPGRYIRRTATEDTELGGIAIKADTAIALNFTVANLDASVFPGPYRFDITREPGGEGIPFGVGPHACIGSTLARIEVSMALEELLRRYPGTTLAGDAEFHPNLTTNSIVKLPVVLRP